jgi:hypothetical protein
MMRRLHTIVGIAGAIAFLATGLYMRRYPSGMASLDGGTRMLFRSRHIYLLLASLLNLGLGTYLHPSPRLSRRSAQVLASLPILTAPPLLLAAFFVEPSRPESGGPLTMSAVIGLLAGTIGHALAADRGPGRDP